MTLLSTIAIVTCFSTLALGGVSLFVEKGYGFDLRRRARRKAARGGRRTDDLVSAA